MVQETATIKHLAFYPVKGAGRIGVREAYLSREGLVVDGYKDHGFMIVRGEPNQTGVYRFVTQRDKRHDKDRPQGLSVMTLIKPVLAGGVLKLTWKYDDPIAVPNLNEGGRMKVKVWDDEPYAVDQGNEVAGWLSSHLSLDVRLVKAVDGSFERKVKQNSVATDNPINFQDGYPIHWFSIESVRELCEKSGQEIPWQSFRPQIVVEGFAPHAEHKIYKGEVAGIPFIDPKPCERCPVTLVDQETGEVRGKEPLRTLSKYKRWRKGKAPIFGENMLPQGKGKIKVGDSLVAVSYRDPPLKYGADIPD